MGEEAPFVTGFGVIRCMNRLPVRVSAPAILSCRSPCEPPMGKTRAVVFSQGNGTVPMHRPVPRGPVPVPGSAPCDGLRAMVGELVR